jgi:hypothetical protein
MAIRRSWQWKTSRDCWNGVRRTTSSSSSPLINSPFAPSPFHTTCCFSFQLYTSSTTLSAPSRNPHEPPQSRQRPRSSPLVKKASRAVQRRGGLRPLIGSVRKTASDCRNNRTDPSCCPATLFSPPPPPRPRPFLPFLRPNRRLPTFSTSPNHPGAPHRLPPAPFPFVFGTFMRRNFPSTLLPRELLTAMTALAELPRW